MGKSDVVAVKRVLIIGAGAVGRLLGCLMTHAGFNVTFVVRQGRKLDSIVARDLDRGMVCRLDSPSTIVAGDAVETPDLVILAVRSDQVDEALLLAKTYLGRDTLLAVVPPIMDSLATRAKASDIACPACALLIAFGAWPVDSELHWFRFPRAKCLVLGDGSPSGREDARQIASVLRLSGLGANSMRAMLSFMPCFLAVEIARCMGWESAGWDIHRLADDDDLVRLTARAMKDAVAIAGQNGGVIGKLGKAIPAGAHRLLLKIQARRMSENMKKIWSYHGPKVASQTRHLADALIDQANRAGIDADAFKALRRRLE